MQTVSFLLHIALRFLATSTHGFDHACSCAAPSRVACLAKAEQVRQHVGSQLGGSEGHQRADQVDEHHLCEDCSVFAV